MSMTLKTTKNMCRGLIIVYKITTRCSTIDVKKKSDLSRKNRTTGSPRHVRKISDWPQPAHPCRVAQCRRLRAPHKQSAVSLKIFLLGVIAHPCLISMAVELNCHVRFNIALAILSTAQAEATTDFAHLENESNTSWHCIKCRTPLGDTYHSYDIPVHYIFDTLASIPETTQFSIA